MKNILLVNNDSDFEKDLRDRFESTYYIISTCPLGKPALAFAGNTDLFVLDFFLPDTNGTELCKTLRERNPVASILILFNHPGENDIAASLDAGANDYVIKPFLMEDLIVRMKALLKRTEINKGYENPSKEPLCYKNLVIDHNNRKVSLNGKRLQLTPLEMKLLSLLARHPGRTFSRSELLQLVWGYTFSGYEHTVTSHINRLRIKIERNPNRPEYVLTSWGSGYRFSE